MMTKQTIYEVQTPTLNVKLPLSTYHMDQEIESQRPQHEQQGPTSERSISLNEILTALFPGL